jgi:CheY-like chemotaxis protein
MTTNAAKYGSLSEPDGKVNIVMTPQDGGILITWNEVDGPTITKPEDVGFGTTLITQAVPYELGGTAEIEYAERGISARFWLPESVLDLATKTQDQPSIKTAPYHPPTVERTLAQYGSALVVEDNLMMAMDMQEILLSLGFQNVDITGVVAEALSLIEDAKPTIAILDVNLGPSGETSFEIAKELLRQEIPFIFVTGYGERVTLDKTLKSTKILTKPVDTNDLHQAILDSLPAALHSGAP